MTKAELWVEITETFNYINAAELKKLTGKTYAQSTKEDLRTFFNSLIDTKFEPKTVSLDDCLNTMETLIKESQLRHQQRWNANVNKFNSIVDILFKI